MYPMCSLVNRTERDASLFVKGIPKDVKKMGKFVKFNPRPRGNTVRSLPLVQDRYPQGMRPPKSSTN
jgi:hypothetical protein